MRVYVFVCSKWVSRVYNSPLWRRRRRRRRLCRSDKSCATPFPPPLLPPHLTREPVTRRILKFLSALIKQQLQRRWVVRIIMCAEHGWSGVEVLGGTASAVVVTLLKLSFPFSRYNLKPLFNYFWPGCRARGVKASFPLIIPATRVAACICITHTRRAYNLYL